MPATSIPYAPTTTLRHELMSQQQQELEQICSEMEEQLKAHAFVIDHPFGNQTTAKISKALSDQIRPVATGLRAALQYKLDKKDIDRIHQGIEAFSLEIENKLCKLLDEAEIPY